jgi:hypothetical protein
VLGLSGLDVLDADAPFLGPDQQLATDVFRTVIDSNCAGLAASLDDTVQAPDDPFGWPREVDFHAQALAGEVIQHAQQPKRTAIAETIRYEVHRLGHVGRLGHRQHTGLVPLQPLAGFDLLWSHWPSGALAIRWGERSLSNDYQRMLVQTYGLCTPRITPRHCKRALRSRPLERQRQVRNGTKTHS